MNNQIGGKMSISECWFCITPITEKDRESDFVDVDLFKENPDKTFSVKMIVIPRCEKCTLTHERREEITKLVTILSILGLMGLCLVMGMNEKWLQGILLGISGIILFIIIMSIFSTNSLMGRKPISSKARYPDVLSLLNEGWSIGKIGKKRSPFEELVYFLEHPHKPSFDNIKRNEVKTYHNELIEYIKTTQNPAEILSGCGFLDIDRMLQSDVVDDAVMERKVNQTKNKDQSEDATLALIHIEGKVKKDGKLIPEILFGLRENKILRRELGLISYDDRVIDYLSEKLSLPWIRKDETAAMSLGDLFIEHHRAGLGMIYAEELLRSNNERVFRAIIQNLLNQIITWKTQNTFSSDQVFDYMTSWCVKNTDILGPYLAEESNHKNEIARLFIRNYQSKT